MVIIMIKEQSKKNPTRFIIMTITVNSKRIRSGKIMVEIDVLL